MKAAHTFKKVLIANRGEIAIRIARTLREMGIASVAIFSDADRTSPHVGACDEAYRVGPSPARESYLHAQAILNIATAAKVDAIHPGYGFLSENAVFADMVTQAGIVFIGPSAAAMKTMGSKTSARTAMQKANIPTVPGSDGPIVDFEHAQQLAVRIGYPIMLKASAGGGGKGMRLVESAADLLGAMRSAASESLNAFGDATIYMEKAIIKPRHIEIQIFSDAAGQTFFIGERECSMQRRHQKVIEEAPSVVVDAHLRQKMGEVACCVAQAVDYRGAGTVEFLLDDAQRFYFLEMNTRLQVEHPVTELCYGFDLVKAQIEVAQGGVLPWQQTAIVSRGHAIEARIYAENPQQQFMPCPGQIIDMVLPSGPFVRVDCGVATGFSVSRYYDPMIAKVIVWGQNREEARCRLQRALRDMVVRGIVTNISFLLDLLASQAFSTGHYHTETIADIFDGKHVQHMQPVNQEIQDAAMLAALIATYQRDSRHHNKPPAHARSSAWRRPPKGGG